MNSNPLLSPSPLPYHLPEFAKITLAHAKEAVEVGFAEQLAEITAITEQEPSWENTVEALEASGQTLERATSWLFNLQGTDSTEELDAYIAELTPRLSQHQDAIYYNEELYRAIEAVIVPKDEESQRLHTKLLSRFERRGAHLDQAEKQRLAELNQRLAQLSEEFGRNLMRDTKALAPIIGDERVSLQLPAVQSGLAELENKEDRATLYAASLARGRESNAANVVEQAKLRAQRAQLLGFDTHADFVIAEETAPSAEAARTLLSDLAPVAAANAHAEYKLAAELAGLAGEEISAADWPYWQAQVAKRDSAFDEAAFKEYFPLHRVLIDGAFYAANLLYGVEVKPRPDLSGYSEGVEVWEVFNGAEGSADGEGIGLLLTDYQARDSKRGGAWMSWFEAQSGLLGRRPVIINVMSIVHEGQQDPLLSLDEVRTLFHEFGHALHGLLDQARYPSMSMGNVPRDWVEFPSQLNENWALHPKVLANYAFHYRTGEAIPAELVAAAAAARQLGQGFATAEYLGAAIIDLAWHSLSVSEAEKLQAGDIDEFEQAALLSAGLDVPQLSPRYRSTFFNHIFSGGYSAAYYSYLWAEALDADGFAGFVQQLEQGEDLRAIGERFRALVLSAGASRDYGQAFVALRGREKDLSALLARRGLAGAVVS